MSITSSLSSALSGLNAASRAAELVSSNIANARTEGYARRGLELTARVVGASGQGVSVAAVTRDTDPVLTGDRRLAGAETAGRQAEADFHARIEAAMGTPGAPGALTTRVSDLDAALIAAAGDPASEPALGQAVEAVDALAQGLHGLSDTLQTERSRADARIASAVTRLNDGLARVADLNGRILTGIANGRDTSALMDQRTQVIDGFADILPLRSYDRAQGQVALYTQTGAALLDGGTPSVFGFAPTPVIAPEMALGGALSGLTLNGRAVSTGSGGPLGGGSMAADFKIRDKLAPEAQARLDAVALDLSVRLTQPGEAGLLLDRSTPGAGELGLSARLILNPALDPDAGGVNWRLRDGLSAAIPGPSGDATRISALQAALTASRTPQSTTLGTGARGLATLASDTVSATATARLSAEREATFSASRADALKQMEAEGGVDSDRELQDLLVIEKAYAANAKVLNTVDDMLQLLLEI